MAYYYRNPFVREHITRSDVKAKPGRASCILTFNKDYWIKYHWWNKKRAIREKEQLWKVYKQTVEK